MCAKKAGQIAASFCLIVFGFFSPVFAQAPFTVASETLVGADIGYAELAGSITFTVIAGTTVEAPIQISYPVPITNNAAAEILVTGTGGLSGIPAAPVLDRENNTIIIQVPGGGLLGDTIEVRGVRLALAGQNLTQVEATVRSPISGNPITVGETNPIVVASIQQPFSFIQKSAPFSFLHGRAANSNSSFMISEEYPSAFAGNAGIGGQTLPTRLRFTPFPSIPEHVHIAFPRTIISPETGAVFQTVSGTPETVPRADGSTDVIYEFSGAAGSETTAESFEFTMELTQDAAAEGTIHFQASLIPIGLATPTPAFPSTDIPRFAERLVPDEADLATGTTELAFPFRNEADGTYTGIALTNSRSYRVRAVLTAVDAEGNLIEGTGITNPVSIILPGNGQVARLASELFGERFNASSGGTIRVSAQSDQMEGFYLTGELDGPQLDGANGDFRASRNWILPLLFKYGIAPFNLLELFNPGNSDTAVRLQLRDWAGNEIAAASRTVAAGGNLAVEADDLFPVSFNSFAGGYIVGNSDLPLTFWSTFGNALESNVLTNQPVSTSGGFYIPHFASGGQYLTELTIVNTSETMTAEIALTPLDNSGSPISSPVTVKIGPRAQLIRTVASLFPDLGSGLATGSIRAEISTVAHGPFVVAPGLAGAVRFVNVDGSASAALPLVPRRTNDFVFSQVAQKNGWFTGVALLNPGTKPAVFKLDVFRADGTIAGSYSSELGPGERISSLLEQLVAASAGQAGGYVRVTSDENLTGFSLFGSSDLRSLSAIPPQDVR